MYSFLVKVSEENAVGQSSLGSPELSHAMPRCSELQANQRGLFKLLYLYIFVVICYTARESEYCFGGMGTTKGKAPILVVTTNIK